MKQKILQAMFAVLVCAGANAQVNSGSDGSDGALDYSSLTNLGYSTNIVIDMHDHPNGIYQYTYVNIPGGLTVSFIQNTIKTPVVWLVQSNCIIGGSINLDGQSSSAGGFGGPGGFAGGSIGGAGVPGGDGLGPGGGMGATGPGYYGGFWGGSGSYATTGVQAGTWWNRQAAPGATYGNAFVLPLIGGSGGGGGSEPGAGGGGAILIAASGSITFVGEISANGGSGTQLFGGGGGSGGAVRLAATTLSGNGNVSAVGGTSPYYDSPFNCWSPAGNGWIRFDALVNTLSGSVAGSVSRGFQPIILPVAGQGVQLSIVSVAGVSVSATPNGQLLSPDAIISGQQANPIPIVVNCSNLPLNTAITVTVTPANGSSFSAVGYNTAGTLASSTATVSLNMPRGGGRIYATAATSN